jgi:thiosulfate dehydrogenase
LTVSAKQLLKKRGKKAKFDINTSKTFMKSVRSSWFPFFLGIVFTVAFLSQVRFSKPKGEAQGSSLSWHAPDINLLPHTPEGDLIRYGRALIVNTSSYLGPKGSIAGITNGMNCQNCHVFAGTRPFGSSFALVASSFPQLRNRSGMLESVEFRVNDCLQRSLNGHPIDTLSREMKAMVAYLKWVGKDVVKENKPTGSGIIDLPYLSRAADPVAGKILYSQKCERCHGMNGEGLMRPDSIGYVYPPLWGEKSYNTAAGIYRLSRFAAFVKYNMPYDVIGQLPQLTDEESWDLAAFVNSQPRTHKEFPQDWPKLENKPPDHPFGPFADPFPAIQHKYGPFGPIKEALEKLRKSPK